MPKFTVDAIDCTKIKTLTGFELKLEDQVNLDLSNVQEIKIVIPPSECTRTLNIDKIKIKPEC